MARRFVLILALAAGAVVASLRDGRPTPYRWLDPYYAGRVGKSIRIYRVP